MNLIRHFLIGIFTFSLLSLTAQAQSIYANDVMPIGFYYQEVTKYEQTPNFMGNTTYVYFKNKKLCRCSIADFSVSPSGDYAVFLDHAKRQIYWVTTATQQTHVVPRSQNAVQLSDVVWGNDLVSATVTFNTQSNDKSLFDFEPKTASLKFKK